MLVFCGGAAGQILPFEGRSHLFLEGRAMWVTLCSHGVKLWRRTWLEAVQEHFYPKQKAGSAAWLKPVRSTEAWKLHQQRKGWISIVLQLLLAWRKITEEGTHVLSIASVGEMLCVLWSLVPHTLCICIMLSSADHALPCLLSTHTL